MTRLCACLSRRLKAKLLSVVGGRWSEGEAVAVAAAGPLQSTPGPPELLMPVQGGEQMAQYDWMGQRLWYWMSAEEHPLDHRALVTLSRPPRRIRGWKDWLVGPHRDRLGGWVRSCYKGNDLFWIFEWSMDVYSDGVLLSSGEGKSGVRESMQSESRETSCVVEPCVLAKDVKRHLVAA